MTDIGPDTSLDVAAEQRRLFLALSPVDRLKMMAAMWDDARRLVEGSLRAAGVSDPIALRVLAFRRIYALDVDAMTLDRMAARLAIPPEDRTPAPVAGP